MPEERLDGQSSTFRDAAESFHEKPFPRWARDPLQKVSSGALPNWASSVLFFLLPSFVSSYFHPNTTSRTKPLHDTAYLDGLRGVAAFIVYLHHTQLMYRFDSLYGYGSIVGADHFLQLPFVRILVAGQASVALFFVISGYVLSIKTLGHIYEGQHEKTLSTLSGSVLRRGVRLYLPFAATTLFLAINAQTNFPVTIPYGNYRMGTFGEQMHHWWKVVSNTVNPLHEAPPAYSPTAFLGVAWTLPIEFTGSMYVFMLLLALSQAKRWIHAVVVFFVGFCWPLAIGDTLSPYTALFCAGMLMAELAIVFPPASSSRNHGVSFFKGNTRHFRHIHQAVSLSLFVLALFLLSAPRHGLKATPGFVTLSQYIPASYDEDPAKFVLAWGAVLMTLVIMYAPTRAPVQNVVLPSEGNAALEQKHYDVANAPFLQRLFTNRVSQYLGRISFSLYLWHEPVKAVVGQGYAMGALALWESYPVMAASMQDVDALKQYDRQYYWSYFAFLIPGLFWTTFWVIWVSDVFCRMVDEPSMRLARRISQWVAK